MSTPAKILVGTLVVFGVSTFALVWLNKSSEVTCRNLPVTRKW